jgi:hypothetical protein
VKGEVQCKTCGHWLTPEQSREALNSFRYKQMCCGKVQYENEVSALTAAHEIYKRHGDSMWPYACEFGDHWHLGHSRARHAAALMATAVESN